MGGFLHNHPQTNDTKRTKDSLECMLWRNNNLSFYFLRELDPSWQATSSHSTLWIRPHSSFFIINFEDSLVATHSI